jgi:CBS-domain-containing membrane protein
MAADLKGVHCSRPDSFFVAVDPNSPFGALMTLLYGLGAAPAAQPRNAIFGQIVSISIAILIGSISTLDVPTKQSLAAALAIAAMTKLGLTHPPAGAAAVLFATDDSLGWTHLLAVIIGNLVAIGLATAISNWSNKRQYPSYWGLWPNLQSMTRLMQKCRPKRTP